jgi:hypothetical protein
MRWCPRTSATTAASVRRSAVRWPKPPTPCCGGGSISSTWRKAARADGAPPGAAGLGRRPANPRCRLHERGGKLAGRRGRHRHATPGTSCATTCPTGWPAAARATRRRVLGAGGQPAAAGAAGPARQHPEGQARCRAGAALADGVRRGPPATRPGASGIEGKPALQPAAALQGGSIEVQDEGSQLLALLTDAKRGEMVVDFCAGAGGKTLALGAMMRNTGRLYAFDVSGHRLETLKPRLARRACPTSTRCRSPTSATNASSACPARSTACWWTRPARAWAPCAATRT